MSEIEAKQGELRREVTLGCDLMSSLPSGTDDCKDNAFSTVISSVSLAFTLCYPCVAFPVGTPVFFTGDQASWYKRSAEQPGRLNVLFYSSFSQVFFLSIFF